MMLNKRNIKKVISEIRQALVVGCDWALAREGVVVKPEDIQYKCGDIGLPLIFHNPSDDRTNYEIRGLYEILRQIDRGELPVYLQQVGIVKDDKNLVNVGAILKEKELKKRSLTSKQQHLGKRYPGLKKGKRK